MSGDGDPVRQRDLLIATIAGSGSGGVCDLSTPDGVSNTHTSVLVALVSSDLKRHQSALSNLGLAGSFIYFLADRVLDPRVEPGLSKLMQR